MGENPAPTLDSCFECEYLFRRCTHSIILLPSPHSHPWCPVICFYSVGWLMLFFPLFFKICCLLAFQKRVNQAGLSSPNVRLPVMCSVNAASQLVSLILVCHTEQPPCSSLSAVWFILWLYCSACFFFIPLTPPSLVLPPVCLQVWPEESPSILTGVSKEVSHNTFF